ncbi:cytochrome P450 [Actinomadura alba]
MTPGSLGELYDPLGVHMDDPYPFFARARREAPIFFSPKADAWVVTRLRDIKEVLRDGKTYSSCNSLRPLTPLSPKVQELLATGYPEVPNFVQLDGEEHRRQREPAAAAFSPEMVDATEADIVEQANALVDAIIEGGVPVDFMGAFANRLPVSVIAKLVGYPPEQHETMGNLSRKAAGIVIGLRFESEDEELDAAHAWLQYQRMVARLLHERRAEPRFDLMSGLVMTLGPEDDDAPLPLEVEALIVHIGFGLALAGHITTSALLGNGLRALLEHPEQWRLLCERPELIPSAVEEIARFDTPTLSFMRQTTTETMLARQRLPAGADVLVSLASGNHDETVFDRADEFDITRTLPTSHVVFGYGAHYCVGAPLARREIEVALSVLTSRLPGLRLVPDQQIAMRPSVSQRGPLSLHVTW